MITIIITITITIIISIPKVGFSPLNWKRHLLSFLFLSSDRGGSPQVSISKISCKNSSSSPLPILILHDVCLFVCLFVWLVFLPFFLRFSFPFLFICLSPDSGSKEPQRERIIKRNKSEDVTEEVNDVAVQAHHPKDAESAAAAAGKVLELPYSGTRTV